MIIINAHELRKVEMRLGEYKSKAPAVISRALNRVASNAKTNINRKTREIYVVKAKDINQTMIIKRANSTKLTAFIISRGQRMPLERFKYSPKKPRPKNPPTALKIGVKKGSTKDLLHAFVAEINGNKIMTRVGKSRLPIKRMYGPAVPQMVKNEEIRRYVERQAELLYKQRLTHEIKRIIEGGN